MVTVPGWLLGAALLAAEPPAGAPQKPEGLYLTLSGAALLQIDSSLETLTGTPLETTLGFDPGFAVQGGVGYTWAWSPVSVSLEVAYAYRTAEFSAVDGPVTRPAGGTHESHSMMVQVVAAVDVADGFGFYAGVGIGATLTRADLLLDVGGGSVVSFPADEDVTFSWQVVGGVQYAISHRVVVYGGVTYFDAGGTEFDAFIAENSSLAFGVGLRVYF